MGLGVLGFGAYWGFSAWGSAIGSLGGQGLKGMSFAFRV